MNLKKKYIPRHWPGLTVAVYGNSQSGKNTYLYDAVIQVGGYSDRSKRIIVAPISDSPWVSKAKLVDPEKCEVLHDSH
jgi:hypothetical protein